MSAIGDLVVNLTARTRGFQKGMKQARGSMALTAISARSLMIAMAPILAPLAAIAGLKRMATAGLDFNRAMKSSTAIMGDLSDVMRGDMRKAAFQVARDTKFSATEAAEAYFFLASAGFSAQKSLAALPVVSKFAQAGMFGLSEATSLLTDAQSALGLKSKNAQKNMQNMTRIADVLVKANTLADATVLEFAQALSGPLAGALRSSNRSLEEGVALLALMAERGQKGAEASQEAMILFRDIPRAFAKNKSAFAEFGLVVADAQGKLLPMAKIIQNVTTQLGPLSDVERAAAFDALGLTRSVGNVLRKLFEGSGELKDFQEQLEQAGGTMKEVADKQLTAFDIGLNKLTGSLSQVGAALASTFGPMLGAAFAKIADIVDGLIFTFQNFSDLAQLALLNIVETALTAFPKMEEPISLVAANFIALWSGVKAFFGAIIQNMIGGLKELGNVAVAIGAGVAAAFASLKAGDFTNIGSAFGDAFISKLASQKNVVAPNAFAEFGKAFAETQGKVLDQIEKSGGLTGFIDEQRKSILDRIAKRNAAAPATAVEPGDEPPTPPPPTPPQLPVSSARNQLAGAAKAGSREAFSAIVNASRGKKPEEKNEKHNKKNKENTGKMLALMEKQDKNSITLVEVQTLIG